MIFFKSRCRITNKEWKSRFEGKDDYTRNQDIALESSIYNEKNKGISYIFPYRIEDTYIDFGVILQFPCDFAEYVNNVFGWAGIEPDEMILEEVTFDSIVKMLKNARNEDFIEDEDDVLEQIGLEGLDRPMRRHFFGEAVTKGLSKKEIYSAGEKLLAKASLNPELDRIYSGTKDSRVYAHPVHYIVESDDHDNRNGIYQTLIEALYDNNRVLSRRYAFTDFTPSDNAGGLLDSVYKSCTWGTVVIRFIADSDDEDEFASAPRETVGATCDVIKRYKDSVLTILCFPAECTNIREIFMEKLGEISFVEIKNDDTRTGEVTAYLKGLAKEKHIRCDKKLFASLDEDKNYSVEELNRLFDRWFSNKIKTKVYPQYKNTVVVRTQMAKEKPKGNAYDELSRMVGLSEAKRVINQALAYSKAKKIFADRGMKQDAVTMHMVFTGNPGTAKTSVARLFAQIMRENGIVSKGHMIEVGRADLVGKYVGWTAPIIKKKFEDASGGVLFIDEAYSLVDDRNGSFGDEAINTIVQEMENHRNDVVVIFAGYPKKMEKFLDKNPGLRSRIAYTVDFPDYNENDLVAISDIIAEQKGVKISAGARDKLASMYRTARLEPDFGNGRYARNVIEKAKMAQAQRLLAMEYDKLSDSDVITISADDIEIPPRTVQKKIMGFCG